MSCFDRTGEGVNVIGPGVRADSRRRRADDLVRCGDSESGSSEPLFHVSNGVGAAPKRLSLAYYRDRLRDWVRRTLPTRRRLTLRFLEIQRSD